MNRCRNTSKITDLPDECLTKIFKYLALNDLSNVSVACIRFKLLAEKVFNLYCDAGIVEIYSYQNYSKYGESVNHFKGKSECETQFASMFRRVKVIVTNNQYDTVFQFIRTNCAEKMISMAFVGETTFEDGFHGKIIIEQIKHLKNLRLVNVPMKKLYENLLQYLTQLKSLHIVCVCQSIECIVCEYQPTRHYADSWMNHSYPELEWISLHTSDNTIDFMPIIHNNPNLRNIACNSLSTIRSICRSNIKFHCVAFILKDSNFLEVESDISNFGRNGNYEKFELSLTGKFSFFFESEGPIGVTRITDVPNVTALHCIFSFILLIDDVLPLVTKLCIIYDKPQDFLSSILQRIEYFFPNLVEFRIRPSSPMPGYSTDYAGRIFNNPINFPKMTQIHFENDETVSFSMADVIKWNRLRSFSGDAPRVTVYLDPIVFHKFNENIVETETLVVKPWLNGTCEICTPCK